MGVIQDFNQKSLHEAITPLLITTEIGSERTFNIALQPQNAGESTWQTAIGQMRQAWKEVYPEKDFDYAFLDDSIAEYYTAEQNIGMLMAWSSGLTIFISCLGLLGLVIYITNQRKKEIGIRKVVGATVSQLISLLTKDFLKLVVLAFIIAIPIAWWGAHVWLQDFAYRTYYADACLNNTWAKNV
jgi:putative ABC transport system permease protein